MLMAPTKSVPHLLLDKRNQRGHNLASKENYGLFVNDSTSSKSGHCPLFMSEIKEEILQNKTKHELKSVRQ